MLDNIELSLNAACGYVKKSEKKLVAAKEDHQAARKVNYFNMEENVLYYVDRGSCDSCYNGTTHTNQDSMRGIIISWLFYHLSFLFLNVWAIKM